MSSMKSLIAIGVSTALLGGYAGLAVAKKTDEEDSVYRWGRWAVLAPAAGNEEVLSFAPPVADNLGRCESETNCPQPQAFLEPPVNGGGGGGGGGGGDDDDNGEPQVGEPVGFARIDYRQRGATQAFDHYVGTISLEEGGAEDSLVYVISGPSAPDGAVVSLNSGEVPVEVGPEGFRSTDRSNPASINGRFTYGADDQVAIVEGPWRQIGGEGAYAHSGEYVAGITATQTQLNALMDQLRGDLAGDVVAYYSGATATGGSLQLDMNLTRETWTGSVQGNVISFNAGGTIDNARFTADRFDSPVSDSITGQMQGALVNAGNNAIGSFAVEADVGEGGVLREADVFNAGLQERSVEAATR